MHSFESGPYTIYHNGDFSGKVEITTTDEPLLLQSGTLHGTDRWVVELPFSLIKEIVAEKIRRDRISVIESMNSDELLGITQ